MKQRLQTATETETRQTQGQTPDRNRDITRETEITKGANINQGTDLETKLGNDGK